MIKPRLAKAILLCLATSVLAATVSGCRPSEGMTCYVQLFFFDRQAKSRDWTHVRTAERRLLAKHPNNAELLSQMASIYAGYGNDSRAAALFRKAFVISQDPMHAIAEAEVLWFSAGIASTDLPAGVAVACKKALAADPGHPIALNGLAYYYAQLSINLDEAERMVRKALAKAPSNSAFIDTLGWIQFRQGDYAAAVRTLEKAVELDGLSAELRVHLSRAYDAAGMENRARIEREKSLKLGADESSFEPESDNGLARAQRVRPLRPPPLGLSP